MKHTAFILACALVLMATSPGSAVDARALHRDAIVVDGHNDIPSWILDTSFDLGMDGADPEKRNAELWWVLGRYMRLPPGDELRTHTDLRRLLAGGVDAQFFSIFADPRRFSGPGEAKARAVAMIEAVEEQVARYPNALVFAQSSDDIRSIAKPGSGKIAVLLGLEGGHSIEHDLDNLRFFHARGVRYMTLTWSNTHSWADSSSDAAEHGGLTAFGRDVVREMNRLGMLIDVSHVSDDTFWDVIETSQAPVIASHSSARALVDIPRNMSDEMLRAVAENGGVVMVNFGGSFIDERKAGGLRIVWDWMRHLGTSPTPLSTLVDHIEHVAKVAGIDHVGLGSDFDGTLFLPEGASDVSGFPAVTEALLARGFDASEVRKILGANFLRAFDEALEVAAPESD